MHSGTVLLVCLYLDEAGGDAWYVGRGCKPPFLVWFDISTGNISRKDPESEKERYNACVKQLSMSMTWLHGCTKVCYLFFSSS